MRSITSWTRSTTTKVAGVGAVSALGLALALGGAGPSASALQHESTGSSAQATDRDGHHKNPKLRAALEKARALSGDERRDALKKIRTDVLSGTYGADAQAAAEHRTELRSALKKARALEGDERRAALKKVWADVRAGKYGKQVERWAKHRHGIARHLPKELRSDLRDMRKDDAKDRAADRDAIKKKALAGDYGPRIERLAENWLE